jgi:hypothetical protein
MADDVDITSEREEIELAARIAHARRVIPLHARPVLDCPSCRGMDQATAKESCGDYAACLSDWEKEQRAKNIEGKL